MDNDLIKEQLRLRSLCTLGILDTCAEERFDRFTLLAVAAFDVPIALVSLVDEERQWFKSRQGLDVSETPRSLAFCSHAIESGETMVVADALHDARFSDNPLVLGAPHIRFYAGHPIRTPEGYIAGTLCIIDTKPRSLSVAQVSMLQSLAQMAEQELHRPCLVRARQEAEHALHELTAMLERRVHERTCALHEKNDTLSREIRQRAEVEASLRRSEQRVRTMIDTSFSAFVAADADGRIIEWNSSAERMFGWARDAVMGLTLSSTIIPAPYRAAHEAGMARFARTGTGEAIGKTLQLRARTHSGNEIDVEMTISAFTLDGRPYFSAFLNDVSAPLQARRALEQKQELLDAVLDSVDVGVVACDAGGNLSFFNRAARQFHGQSPGEGDAVEWAERYALYEADGKTRLAACDIPLLRALGGETVKDARMVIAPQGMKPRTVLASGRRLVGSSGERLGAVVAFKDISELDEWQVKLRGSEQMLRTIAENLPTLIAQVDRNGRFVFLNSRSDKFYGTPAQQLIGQPVRAAYSETEYAKIAPHVEATARGHKSSFESHILIDGKQLHYHAAFVPHVDANGEPDGYFAMAFDITTRREAEILRLQGEERLRTITDNVPVLISYLDSEFRFQFANAMYKDWLGRPSADMLGKTVEEVFGAHYFEERKPGLLQALDGRMSNVEAKVIRKGHERILSSTYIPHHRDGKVVGIYVLSTDATASRQHERQLLALANADPLTNLPNRRMYEFHLDKSLALARRQGTHLALMYLDLDNFKRINDALGHGAGDAVLVEFGHRVRSALRESDMLARLAGDEFTVVLEAVGTVENCEAVARKILAVLEPPFAVCGQALRISASIGIAFGGAGATAATLGHDADAALYASKRQGKNRFCVIAAGREIATSA